MQRPSDRSIASVELVILMSWMQADGGSSVEVFMPSFQQYCFILPYNSLQFKQFMCPKASASINADRVNPEFCCIPFALNMNVRRLIAVVRVEKEPIWADSQWCWHNERISILELDAILLRLTSAITDGYPWRD